MTAVTSPPIRFQTAELQRRFDAAADAAGVDRDPAEVAMLKAGLAQFGTKAADGTVEISPDAFERFAEARMKYEQRLHAGLAEYARQDPLSYVVGNLSYELAEKMTFGHVEGGEEFRRRIANFSFCDFPEFVADKK